jgi:plasmid stability protein
LTICSSVTVDLLLSESPDTKSDPEINTMVQLVIELPQELADRLQRRAGRTGRSIAAEVQELLTAAPMTLGSAPSNAAFGTGLAADLAELGIGITPSVGVALDESLAAVCHSRSDSIHRWIDWGFDDEDAESNSGK